MRTHLFYLATCALTLSLAKNTFAQATFEGLGFLSEANKFSQAFDVSDDGSVIVGISVSEHDGVFGGEAFRWEDGIMQGLGDLDGARPDSRAQGVSGNGSVVVGYSNSPNTAFLEWEAMKWAADTGMVGLGDFVEEMLYSEATDVSYDGSVIVGRSYTTGKPMLWINGELQYLEEDAFGEAWGISSDGSVVVGSADIDDVQQAFRWTQETGFEGLGAPGGGYSVAFKISADGNTVVGFQAGDNIEAFRWAEETGMEALGFLPGGNYSSAKDVSDDGATLVGISNSEDGFAAFIWREETGMQNLKELLETEYGLDLSGWLLSEATAISADGTTIVGTGVNPDGVSEGWKAVIPLSPGGCIAPNTFLLDEITDTTVSFSWEPSPTEVNGYNWFVMNFGAFPDMDDPVAGGTTEPGINFAFAMGLTPGTSYQVYLQTKCDGEESNYGGPFTIMTTQDMGIGENNNPDLLFYPNPTTGIINIQTKEKINSVSVYNAAGQKVPFNSLNKENTSIDISSLSGGIYFIELNLNNKTIKRYKVIRR